MNSPLLNIAILVQTSAEFFDAVKARRTLLVLERKHFNLYSEFANQTGYSIPLCHKYCKTLSRSDAHQLDPKEGPVFALHGVPKCPSLRVLEEEDT